MSNAVLLPSLLLRINQNQLALEAVNMELTLWVEQRGACGADDAGLTLHDRQLTAWDSTGRCNSIGSIFQRVFRS
ncbi:MULTISPECIES: hypothetical protein [unclassified Pseudomonas]|jgi:hypothetical protein|uniref:hypothetical protein n=1 Tax=unclassified Pseudomonas TaxID=196821 RepID=UPI0011AEEEA0|nr:MULTISPECIES: hypothetical protein [unclassified Pseudomonas]MDP9690598.1 hypothetical protein [Pseudomonas mohnii]